MDRARFESLVIKAVEELPGEFQEKLENVDVVVEDWPSSRQVRSLGLGHAGDLLGLYEGVPQTGRGPGYNLVLPDKITIFQKPIEAICRSDEQIAVEIGKVVRHEIAHHFGLGDRALREIEKQKRRRGRKRP